MNIKMAERMNHFPESFIRRLLQQAHGEGFISLAGGHPMADMFPVEDLSLAAEKAAARYGTRFWQYGKTAGENELRQYVCDYYTSRGMHFDIDNILITTGSQQALDLLGKVFLESGAELVSEDPGYLGALQVFALYQAKVLALELDNQGPNIEQAEQFFSKHDPRFFYCTPVFQNPSNIIYTEERSRQMAEILNRNNILTVIDDPYSEIYFNEKPEHHLASMLDGDKRLLLGTFSKTVSPAFRLGWVAGPKDIINQLARAKQASDLHSSVYGQLTFAEFLESGKFENHLEKLRNAYRHKAGIMVDALAQFPEFKFQKPEGGMFVWGRMKSDISTLDIYEDIVKRGVAYVPGQAFKVERNLHPYMRLNYTFSCDQDIKAGIQRIFSNIS